MRKHLLFVLVALVGIVLRGHDASAQTSCTSQSLSANLSALADNQGPGAITPHVIRNLACSAYGSANNNINAKNAGLPTGGDDTTGMNTVISSAVSAGVAAYFPAGTYKHAGDIICNGCVMYGDGPGTIFQSTQTTATNPTVAIMLEGTNPWLRDVQLTNTWSGARQSNGDSCMVWVTGATGFKVENTVISSGASCGVQVYQSSAGEISGNHISGGLADGIIHGGGTLASFNNLVSDNYIYNTGDDGISVDTYAASAQIYNIRIIGNHLENIIARSISINGGTNILVDSNVVSNPQFIAYQAGSDVGQAATTDVLMSNNICYLCGGSGTGAAFFSWGQSGAVASHITWSNNHAYDTSSHCFQIGGGTNFTLMEKIIGNTCSASVGTSGLGVALDGVTNVTITSNVFQGFRGAIATVGSNVNTGQADITNNLFDGILSAGSYAIWLNPDTFTSAVLTGNTLSNDGTTLTGMAIVSGIPNVYAEGNLGDNTILSITGNTGTNCASSASPAVCGNATTGSVAFPTGTNPTLTVNTTAVLAGSTIVLTPDDSLGTKLGITCNSTITTQGPWFINARSAGTSFTAQVSAAPATNKLCFNYKILN